MNEFSFKNLDPYTGLSEEELCRIAPSSIGRIAGRGTVLYDAAHPAPAVYVIKDGEVELVHEIGGNVVVFDTLGPGAVFGDLGGDPPTHTARVTRRSTLCVTPVDAFLAVISAHPELVLHFLRTMNDRIRDYELRLRESHVSARERVYAEVVRLQEQQRRRFFPRTQRPTVAITHDALARRTGLNRVTVTRAIGSLKDDGILRELPEGGYEVL